LKKKERNIDRVLTIRLGPVMKLDIRPKTERKKESFGQTSKSSVISYDSPWRALGP